MNEPAGDDPSALVVETIREHAAGLLAMARRYSLCPDDAQDAYQRAIEIFIKRAHRLDREGAAPWLRTVVKHEALAVRAGRQRLLAGGDIDLQEQPALHSRGPEELAAESDRLTRSAEALARLKPHELRALLLKAQGHSYREISELTGWSYTKVNRCLTEGRRRFLDRYAGIESGEECDRWAPLLSAIADGEASPSDLVAVRPHLRNCPACRAALRDFRAVPSALASLVPVAGLALSTASGPRAPGALARVYEAVVSGASDRLVGSAQKLQASLEVASSGKLAALAVSVTALGGSAVAIDGQRLGSGTGASHRHSAHAHLRSEDRGVRASHLVSQAASDTPIPPVAQPQPTGAKSPAPAAASASMPSPTPAASQAAEFGAEGSQGGASTAASASAASTAAPARASPAGASASSGGGGEFSP
jgi:RNA polymerase sigma factor (sigma-70 family)